MLTFRSAAAAKTNLLPRDNGFLDEVFGNEREIVRVDPAFERRTLVMPLARISSATRALVASLGHEQ
jgi:hypothetical protein